MDQGGIIGTVTASSGDRDTGYLAGILRAVIYPPYPPVVPTKILCKRKKKECPIHFNFHFPVKYEMYIIYYILLYILLIKLTANKFNNKGKLNLNSQRGTLTSFIGTLSSLEYSLYFSSPSFSCKMQLTIS